MSPICGIFFCIFLKVPIVTTGHIKIPRIEKKENHKAIYFPKGKKAMAKGLTVDIWAISFLSDIVQKGGGIQQESKSFEVVLILYIIWGSGGGG